jgi:hypothetical protein
MMTGMRHFLGRRLDGGDDFEVVVERVGRRHEDVELAVARLGAHRRRVIQPADSLKPGGGVGRLFPGPALQRRGQPARRRRRPRRSCRAAPAWPETRRAGGVAGQRIGRRFGSGGLT